MLINLSELLTVKGKSKEYRADIEFEAFESRLGVYKVLESDKVSLEITHHGNREISIKGKTRLVLSIPCDRCLQEVLTPIDIEIERTADMNVDNSDTEQETDEQNYIDGYNLDVDKLVYDEILINLPMKILCKEDCNGICNRCGANLNIETCDCDREVLDPRMSVIRDIFNNFKEV
ncbi:MAG: DUF177 domain-containing protein [Lachnospiraceae bacterium]|nr:DUF177 domain-containing protein [Lachnospira sp.]MBR6698236.1 DUF177 domain-containing protein [Lachnospiraceae bacterium]